MQDAIGCLAGMIERGELPSDAAKRGLLEHIRYSSEHWFYLGPAKECSLRLINALQLFFANRSVKSQDQNLAPNGKTDPALVPFQQVPEMLMNGTKVSNSTGHAFHMALMRLENDDEL